MTLDVKDQSKYKAPVSAYPDTVVGEPGENDGQIPTPEDVRTTADPTKQIDGPHRRTITPLDVGAFLAALPNPVVRGSSVGQILMGFTIREVAGGAARIQIRRQHVIGQRIDTIVLAANGNIRQWYGDDGIDVEDGIAIEWITGSVDLILWLAHE